MDLQKPHREYKRKQELQQKDNDFFHTLNQIVQSSNIHSEREKQLGGGEATDSTERRLLKYLIPSLHSTCCVNAHQCHQCTSAVVHCSPTQWVFPICSIWQQAGGFGSWRMFFPSFVSYFHRQLCFSLHLVSSFFPHFQCLTGFLQFFIRVSQLTPKWQKIFTKCFC